MYVANPALDIGKHELGPATVVIAGGGLVGLVLALALKKHCGIVAEIYEKADGFYDEVGAALGCYPNGLRVLRVIDPKLVRAVQGAGCAYKFRSWEQQDGAVIASAEESVFSGDDPDLYSIGIRRYQICSVL